MAPETARGLAGTGRAAKRGRPHAGDCTCGACPHGAREGHRRAVEAFGRRRDELADGYGIPEGLAHSPGASRQWVSDELTQSARTVSERAGEAHNALLGPLFRHTVIVVWSTVGLFLLGVLSTAIGHGWTLARTAGLLAAVLLAVLISLTAWLHRSRGGVLAPLIGADNRLSTSTTVAVGWLLLAGYTVLLLTVTLAGQSGAADRDALLAGLDLPTGGGLLTAVALSCAVPIWVRHTVASRVRSFSMQKVRAARPRAADLLTDDAGRGSFAGGQYVAVNAVALLFAAVRLAREPRELPDLPWPLTLLVAVSAITYVTAKYTEGGRPVILSVVRIRELGDLHAPIRPGDDIEIRGSGFVPAGAQPADRLAETVVRIGAVCVPVPLVPAPGGFRNPRDTLLTVPVPAEVDTGKVEVQVITAAGTESGRYRITITD